MKRLNKSIATVCLAALSPATFAADLFADPNFAAAVRQHVYGKRDNQEPLTEDDVKSLSSISAKGKGIKSLAGIEHCKSLMLLEAADNQISDLAPLKTLDRLQSLDVAGNQVKDLAPLAGLPLQYLNVARNQVESLAPLAAVKTLNSLDIAGNRVRDLAPVAGLPRMWSLYAENNRIADLAPVVAGARAAPKTGPGSLTLTGNPLGAAAQGQIAELQKLQREVRTGK